MRFLRCKMSAAFSGFLLLLFVFFLLLLLMKVVFAVYVKKCKTEIPWKSLTRQVNTYVYEMAVRMCRPPDPWFLYENFASPTLCV